MDTVLLLSVICALGAAWWFEREKRKKIEIEHDLEMNQRYLSDIHEALSLSEDDYYEAVLKFNAEPIPDYMFEHVSPGGAPDGVSGPDTSVSTDQRKPSKPTH